MSSLNYIGYFLLLICNLFFWKTLPFVGKLSEEMLHIDKQYTEGTFKRQGTVKVLASTNDLSILQLLM